MAVISPAIVTNHPPGDGSVITYSWTMVTNLDTGAPIPFAQWADRSVQMSGTWGAGGGTITWEGSNDGTTYFALSDPRADAIAKTADALEQVVGAALWARPRVSVASVTSVVVTLLARKQIPMR